MDYSVSYQNPNNHYVDISVEIDSIKTSKIQIQLPSWRPGRYELGNFAKNIQKWEAYSLQAEILHSKKIKKDLWEVDCQGNESIVIRYNYFANELNAGSTYLDDNQLYINGVNCLLYVPERIEESCTMSLELPENYEVACGLSSTDKFMYIAENFHQLVDAPLLASANMKNDKYSLDGTDFYLWFQGECKPDFKRLKKNFKAFTKKQMELFGGFPAKTYHFIFQILPHRAYHGVEHCNSTVCLLGPSYHIMDKEGMYNELLGVSSHELFHSWNVKRIRPEEMWPYDYSCENYSRLGYLAEGVTTLYGDLMLLRSAVFSLEDYFKTFNQLLDRHFNNPGVLNMSVADSSFDTWLDGYVPGIPNRKASIYTEGALCTFMLDILIRKYSNHQQSFDDVMRSFYKNNFLKNKGVSENDYVNAINHAAGKDLSDFVNKYINGTEDYTQMLNETLSFIGLQFKAIPAENFWEAYLGFKIFDSTKMVIAVFPGSPAEIAGLSINDELIDINGYKVSADFNQWCNYFSDQKIDLSVKKTYGRIEKLTMQKGNEIYFKKYLTEKITKAADEQLKAFEHWRK